LLGGIDKFVQAGSMLDSIPVFRHCHQSVMTLGTGFVAAGVAKFGMKRIFSLSKPVCHYL
jgi:hypothetical protein